jgi:hypothetical protein
VCNSGLDEKERQVERSGGKTKRHGHVNFFA